MCRLLLLVVALLWPGMEILAGNPPPFVLRGKRIEVRGRQILVDDEPEYLRGICYSPFIAGSAPWENRFPHVDFSRDLREIKRNLNANAVRVFQVIRSRSFYDRARAEGLWILQGIHINTQEDLDPIQQLAEFKAHVRSEVDLIHSYGASDVILCYVIGNEVPIHKIREVIENHQDRPRYSGKFFSTPDEARLPRVDGTFSCPRSSYRDPHPFQSLIAELADEAAKREQDGHGIIDRRLYGHASDPRQSIAVSARNRLPDDVPVDMSFLDIVFQNIYSYYPPTLRFLGFRWYLEEASRAYPENPFVVLECGYSTSPDRANPTCAPGPFCSLPAAPQPYSYCFGRNSEWQQARGIFEQFRRATAEPPVTAGFFVFEFYDEWWKSERPIIVHDEDRPEEWFGIKAVEGTTTSPIIRNKMAFETVGRMFNPDGWCPTNGDLVCHANSAGVEITLGTEEELDKVSLMRNGWPLTVLGPGELTFFDPGVPPGTYVYSALVEDALVVCEEEIRCEVEVPVGGFKRGDADADGGINITDPIFLLTGLFLGGPLPSCDDAADSNDDNRLDITDGIYLLNWLFAGGPEPPAPGPEDCGADSNKALGCESFPPCAER